MTTVTTEMTDRIRDASRRMVRELGFMRPALAGTDYHASAVHALIEVEARGPLTPAALAALLGLEKSSISRLLHKLVTTGELRQAASAQDGRSKLISLTDKGRRTLKGIHAVARQQVDEALRPLTPEQRQTVADGLACYAQALEGRPTSPRPPTIEKGYRPGVIGRVAELHAAYYSRNAGFGVHFEQRVAVGMADLCSRLDNPDNGLWIALDGGRVVGSIAIDGEDLGEGVAHLRFFIVDESVRGKGLGGQMLAEAMRFCDAAGFSATRLWTFRGLDAARRLYERAGFRLETEAEGTQWGKSVMEQVFVRPSPVPARAT